MGWNPIDDPIDYVMLAGQRTPGLAVVEGAGTPRNWNKAQGYGISGATLRYLGLDLSEFTITIRLFTVEDWAAWDAFKPVVATPPRGKYPKAIDAWHPLLEACDIRSIVVKNVKQPTRVSEAGEWNVVIECSAYRKPKRTLVKPDGSKTEKKPVDPADQLIEDLTKQVQELAK